MDKKEILSKIAETLAEINKNIEYLPSGTITVKDLKKLRSYMNKRGDLCS